VISFVDDLGHASEQEHQRAVIAATQLHQETIIAPWHWSDDGIAPPVTDIPQINYPMYARDRASISIVRRNAGRILLTGDGGDHVLTGDKSYLADRLARGEIRPLLREASAMAVAGQKTIWHELYNHAIVPLGIFGRHDAAQTARATRLLDPRFVRQFDLGSRVVKRVHCSRRWRSAFTDNLIATINNGTTQFDRGVCAEELDVRYPFYDRPLIEFVLTLPPGLIRNALQSKIVLRESMRGLLPESVRSRVDKAGAGARLRWALAHEARVIDKLLTDSLLAQLGCIDPHRLRRAIEKYKNGIRRSPSAILNILSLETWLRVKSGQWNSSQDRAIA
jgi:asparagine synthase (glutamine-hydrolysing)